MLPLRAVLAVSACVPCFIACAQGDSVDTGFDEVGGGGVGGDGGAGSTTSTTSAHSSSSSGPTTSASTTSSSSTTGGGACDTEAPDQCASAEDLGEVRGDDGNDIVVESGNTSKWYKVRITESVSSPISFPQLSYRVSLESPPGMNYDLYVYPGDTMGVDCSVSPQQGSGDPESVSATWGDSLNSEDGTYFTFEVRYVDGVDCDADWTFTVEGHTNP
jgi:hypothetical protein